jgi:hypothetical protein
LIDQTWSTGRGVLVDFDLESQESREKIVDQVLEIAVPLIAPHEEDSFDAEVAVGQRFEDGTRVCDMGGGTG